jgi:hypothetical protein
VNRRQLDRAVARATGESLRTVRALGFFVLPDGPPATAPDDLALGAECPRCGRAVPHPGWAGGAPALAECADCDLYFEPRPGAIEPATSERARASA